MIDCTVSTLLRYCRPKPDFAEKVACSDRETSWGSCSREWSWREEQTGGDSHRRGEDGESTVHNFEIPPPATPKKDTEHGVVGVEV